MPLDRQVKTAAPAPRRAAAPVRATTRAISPSAALQSRIGVSGVARLAAQGSSSAHPSQRLAEIADTARRLAEAPAPVARRTNSAQAATPEARSPDTPTAEQEPGSAAAEPGFADLKKNVAHAARSQRRKGPSAKLADRASKAALKPSAEGDRNAAEATLEDLKKAKTEDFEADAFKRALLEKLIQLMPQPVKSAEQLKRALDSGTAQTAATAMQGELAQQQTRAVGELPAAAATARDPKQSQPPPPPDLAAPSPGARPQVPDAAGAAPPRAPDAALDTSGDRADADAQLASENLTQRQLKGSGEPSFVSAAETRDQAEQHSTEGPAQVRSEEAALRGAATAKGASLLSAGMASLGSLRGAGFLQAFARQGAAKTKEETERERIGKVLQDIQARTRADVDRRLDVMETEAEKRFKMGLEFALNAFETKRELIELAIRDKAEAEAREDYDIIEIALARWGDLDEAQVNAAIEGARNAYYSSLSRTIDRVAEIVGAGLADAKKRIAQGRAEATAFVASLDVSVRAFGAETLAQIDGEFEAMSASVDARRDGLIDRLGESYAAAQKVLEDRIQAFRDANKSWWQKVKEKVRGVLNAIRQIKDLFFSILARAAGIIGDILSDPGGFVSTLISGVKQGFAAFRDKIGDYLQKALFEWLFGQLSAAGVQLPERYDAKGIFGLIASVLGLTYANIRARAVRLLGEATVARVEGTAEVFRVLLAEGPAGLWEMLSNKLTDVKEQAITFIKDLLIARVIKAGITWVLSLFSPVSGFIKACKAIYAIVMFFVERAAQIAQLVNSVLDSLAAVAAGNASAVARKIEDALASGLSLVIGLLASVLGLGNMGGAIRSAIERIRAPVDRAIDWLIGKAMGGVQTIRQLASPRQIQNSEDEQDPVKAAKLKAGIAALDAGTAAVEVAGKLRRSDAEIVARDVRAAHPIFKSIHVAQAGTRWTFKYTASPEREHDAGERMQGAFVLDRLEIKEPTTWKALKQAQATSGDEYELGIGQNVVRGVLIQELEDEFGKPIQIVMKGSKEEKLRSAIYMGRLFWQRGIRVEGQLRRPEARLEIVGPAKAIESAISLEISLQSDMTKIGPTTREKFSAAKAGQVYHTMELMVKRYRKSTPIKMIYLCPDPPTPATEELIRDMLSNPLFSNITYIWKIVSNGKKDE